MNFLKECQKHENVPKGIRLSFNLAKGVNNLKLVDKIRYILNEGSSRIKDQLIDFECYCLQEAFSEVSNLEKTLKSEVGHFKTISIVRDIKSDVEHILRPVSLRKVIFCAMR